MGTTERRNEIIKILCRRRYDTIGNLANEFNVSYRTLRRDIEALSCYVPIYTQNGRYGGGVYMVDGYSMDNIYMNENELNLLNKILQTLSKSENYLRNDEFDKLEKLIKKYTKPTKNEVNTK